MTFSKLEAEARQVLAGADYVREKLFSLLNIGPSSISDNVYAVKCRVKAEDSLLNKVRYKRKIEGRPDYLPTTVTDVVGLRLLALSNQQMLPLCKSFINFVRLCMHHDIALISGGSLGEAISEVKVYKSAVNPLVYDEIYAYLCSLNAELPSDKIELKIATDAAPYSSVHIVLHANSFHTRRAIVVPLEVQIRTVFEDAWAEVDHPLRYKGTHYQPNRERSKYSGLMKIADGLSADLKADIETCAKKVDKLQNIYAELSEWLARNPYSKIKHIPFGPRLSYRDVVGYNRIPPALKRQIRDIDLKVDKISRLLDSRKDAKFVSETLDVLIRSTKKLVKRCTEDAAIRRGTRELVGWVKMDQALFLMWRSRILLRNPRNAVGVSDVYKEALEIYLELNRHPQFSKEAILKSRLVFPLELAEDRDTALKISKESVELLRDDKKIPKRHVLRISIPRQYSYLLWKSKQEIWYSAHRLHQPSYQADEQVKLLKEALVVTQKCMLLLKEMTKNKETELEEIKLSNNLIAYTWELKNLGAVAKLSQGERSAFSDMRTRIEAHLPKYGRVLGGLDTALKAADLVGDRQSKRRLRTAVSRELKKQSQVNTASDGYTANELAFIKYCLGEIRI